MPLIERVLDRTPCETLDDHQRRGGCAGLEAARGSSQDTVIAEIEASGLRGRGGAGFPTGVKWRTVAGASTPGSTPVVVNAAEGEPATFKDRQLIRMNPFKIIEGALIAAHAVNTDRVVIALKATFGPESTRLRDAVAAMTAAGWTRDVDVQIVEGPSEYLFGEETGLLEVLEGRRPFPRIAPPYLRGVDGAGAGAADDGAPALVDNVETLANVPAILAQGADWYRSVGTAESPGTLVCTITGHCRRHGVGEVPMGTPLREAITLIGGGAEDGRRIVAAMSGVANPLLPESQLDTPLSYEAMAEVGSGLGAGGFFVCDDQTDIAAVVYGASRFLAVESCGQCEPCKRDGLAIAARLRAVCTAEATEQDLAELPDLVSTVADGARCFLATQQQRVVGGALQTFPAAFRAHLDGVPATAEPIVPITDIADGRAALETSHLAKQPDWTYDELDSGSWPAALGSTPAEVDTPRTRAVPDDAGDVVATGETDAPDPLQPLLDMHAGIRSALDRLRAADDRDRGDAIDELRQRLALHADVTRRVVHPMASRVAEAPADDAGWRAERDETVADRLLARLDHLDADRGGAASSVQAIAAEIREAVDRDETQILGLLRTHMDERDLGELGNAIHEACAASNVPAGRAPMTSGAETSRRS